MRPNWILMIVAFLAADPKVGEAARILAFLPFPAKSHQALFTPILRELAQRGHQVTAYVPSKMPNPPPNYKEVLVPNVMENLLQTVNLVEMSKMNSFQRMMSLLSMGIYFQEKMCSDDSIRRLIRSNEKFDAVILESFFVQESFTAFQHKFDAVPIELISFGGYFWPYDLVGSPYNPSYMPDAMYTFSDSMNFIERLQNTVMSYTNLFIGYNHYLPKVETLMNSCFDYDGGQARPLLVDMLANKSLVLENSHFSLTPPIALAPHVVSVGGLNVHPRNPLPKDIQKFMDDAKDGVIYFSLGSNLRVSDVAQGSVFDAFVTAFGKMKQRILWKWETEDFPNRPANVLTSKWFPQQDILAHKNCKLFITHGGFLSITEASAVGVPLVGIPFFGDQPKNMNQVEKMGMGVQLDPSNLTEHSISWAVNEVLSNPSYREVAKAKSVLFNDRPMSPLDTAVYWIEYVIRHKGAAHLRPSLNKLSWYQSTLLDVAAVLITAALAILLLTYLMFKKLLCLIFGRKCQSKGPKNTTSKLKSS